MKNPGVFSSRVLWVEYYCTLHGPRVSWNAIHATVRMRPGWRLDKHGWLSEWIEFCFHHVPIIVYLWLTVNHFLNFYLSSSPNWLREPDSNRRPSAYETDEMPTFPSRGNTYIDNNTALCLKVLNILAGSSLPSKRHVWLWLAVLCGSRPISGPWFNISLAVGPLVKEFLTHCYQYKNWNTGWDLNSRLYGFAIRCIWPLCHLCIFL